MHFSAISIGALCSIKKITEGLASGQVHRSARCNIFRLSMRNHSYHLQICSTYTMKMKSRMVWRYGPMIRVKRRMVRGKRLEVKSHLEIRQSNKIGSRIRMDTKITSRIGTSWGYTRSRHHSKSLPERIVANRTWSQSGETVLRETARATCSCSNRKRRPARNEPNTLL